MDFNLIKEKVRALLKKNKSPHDIALGVAIGVFICCLPLYGLHTILVIILAIMVKSANKIAMLIGTSLSIPPTVPFITWAGYSIGNFLLGENSPTLDWAKIRSLNFQALKDLYYPLFLGSVVLGVISAIIFYYIVYWFLKVRTKKG